MENKRTFQTVPAWARNRTGKLSKNCVCVSALVIVLSAAIISGLPELPVPEARADSGPAIVSVEPASVFRQVGETFTISVRISNIQNAYGLYGFEIQFTWNPAIVRHVAHVAKVPMNSYPDGILYVPTLYVKDKVDETASMPNSEPGTRYWVAYASMLPATQFMGEGTVFQMTFQVIASGSSPLGILYCELGDKKGEPVEHELVPGYFSTDPNARSLIGIMGHKISLNYDNTVDALVNVTMLSPFLYSTVISCCLVLVDTTGKEVYNNFDGIGGPQDGKETTVKNNTITAVEFSVQLQEPRPGKYAYTVSIWSSSQLEMYDSLDFVPAFDVKSWPVRIYDLGTLNAESYLEHNPIVPLRRFESVNYTFRLAEGVTDLSVKLFTLLSSDFTCTMNASNAQMDLHGRALWPDYNAWHNVPAHTYMMSLELESSRADLIRIVIQAGPSLGTPSVEIIEKEPTGDFATPGGIMNYKVDVGFGVATCDTLVLTATLDGEIHDSQSYSVEPFESNKLTAYLQVNAPPETGQYTVGLRALLLDSGAIDDSSASLSVEYSEYHITVSPTVKYYQDRLRLKFWEKGHIYVADQTKLSALDVTNIEISGIDKRDSETQKPTMVSISFDAENKEKDIHHAVYVKIGSNSYQIGVVIGEDDPSKMEAHNIPVDNDKVSFTILYRRWTFGNWVAEVGTQVAKGVIGLVLPCVAPTYSPIWFATGGLVQGIAKYTMLYVAKMWVERENGYMTIDDATRIIENAGIQQSVFAVYLNAAVGVNRNPFYAFVAAVEFLHDSEKMSGWNYARAYIAALAHILGKAEAKLPGIMSEALKMAVFKLTATVLVVEIVKGKMGEVLNPKCFLRVLGGIVDGAKAIWAALKILVSPSEEGKEVSDAQLGPGSAVTVDPVVSASFRGQVDYTNDTCFEDMLSLNVSLNRTRAQMVFEVDGNLTAEYLPMFSDSVCRSGIMSSFGFSSTQTSMNWVPENATFILEANGSSYDGIIDLHFHMNSTYVEGVLVTSVDALGAYGVAWLNGTLSYPFGKDLTYEVSVTMPSGSEIIQILSDGNFTVHDYTIVWDVPIDWLAVEFVPPNVAVYDCYSAKTVVGQGYSFSINATACNYGTCTQTVNVTVYAYALDENTSMVLRQPLVLEAGVPNTVTLVCSTAGLLKGCYNISVEVGPIEGEMLLYDNKYWASFLSVTILGDVDGDFDVDIFDVVRITSCYGKTSIDPLYYPNADIDGNGAINIFDVVICTGHYGQKWP